MSAHDQWLRHYTRDYVTVWCPNPDCTNHAGIEVTLESEYGQAWTTPEECDQCHRDWAHTAPEEEEEHDDED